MSKILLINPPYFGNIYANSKFRVVMSQGTMPLGLCCVAASMIKAGHEVEICDMNVGDVPYFGLWDYVGFTSTTPIIRDVYKMMGSIRDFYPEINFIIGGTHATARPVEVRQYFDMVCIGEGEWGGFDWGGLKPAKNLDDLPIPAYHLLDSRKYCLPRLISRKNPVAYIQTSRGCFGKCIYCTKGIEGNKLRFKSPERVVEEMEYVLSLGYREVQIIDDNFTADLRRVYRICELILEKGLKFPWYPRNGIRVDRVSFGDLVKNSKISHGLLATMKRAGCYRVPFGVESGSQRVLDRIKKGIKLEQVEDAIYLAKKAGLETEAYFMFGLPTETEEDLQKTVDFAVKIDPDYAKFATTIPFPGTELYDEMDKDGRIHTKDWSKYHFAISPREIYTHDTLSWDILEKYSRMAYIKFYFRPKKILTTLFRTIRNGTFFSHVNTLLKTRW
jgi:anaerobic magnesium-protoporphyrin IX monomethyl ester cyclase